MWAGWHGIGLSPKHPELLAFVPDQGDSRFWAIPFDRDDRLALVTVCIDALAPWERCWVYKRQGPWSFVRGDRPHLNDFALEAINRWIGIPEGHIGSVRLGAPDRAALALLLMMFSEYGSNTWYDLYFVPDHARQFLWLDHEDALWVFFKDLEAVAPFVERMTAAGFALPTEPPSPIIWQHWMGPKPEGRRW